MQEEPAETKIAVLLVDDQRFIGAALGLLLARERDITLHFCQHASQAVALANDIRPAVILQDLVLPDTDGLTMIALFRANAATARTPVVVLSATDDAETRARARAAGAADYLIKLPSADALVSCIRRQVGRAVSEVAAAPEGEPEEPAVSLGVLDELREEDGSLPEFAATLIDEFVSEVTAQVAALAEARRIGNTTAFKATLHGLKGSTLTMGARRLAGLCAALEQHLVGGSVEGLPAAMMTGVERELQRVIAALVLEREQASEPGGGLPQAEPEAAAPFA
jgi:DNA-binding response OmpR family regulator